MSQDSKGGLGSIVKAGKDAAVVAKKQAERKKIQTVDLFKAYYQLGKSLYSNGSERKQFPELHSKIGELQTKIKELKSEIENKPNAEKLADKAKQVAIETKQKAEIKTHQLQISRLLAKLGEQAFEVHGNETEPAELATSILSSRNRIEILSKEIQELEDSSKGKFLTPKRILIGVACFAGLCLMSFVGSMSEGGSQQTAANGEVTANADSSVASISAARLYAAYEANEVAADSKYKGKELKVSGVVDKIGKSVWGTTFVALKSGDRFGVFNVNCYFDDKHKARAAEVRKGQYISVRGTCNGKTVGIEVNDCIFAN